MIKGVFNVKSFFTKGFCTTSVDLRVCDHLLTILRTEPLVEGDGVYKSENFRAPMISKFESQKIIPSENRLAPKELIEFYNIAKSHDFFRPIREFLGDFTQGCPMINHYRRGDGMVWHTDALDATAMTCCLYLTGDEFTHEDGGWLGVGREINGKVAVFDRILPNHGVLVIINNLDPSNRHRVEPVKSPKERNTLLFHLGYAEHTLTKNRLRDVRNVIEP
jgi:hypothetical protein